MDLDETASLAFKSPEDIASYLEAIGDEDSAALIRRTGVQPQSWATTLGFKFLGAGHLFGFIGGGDGSVMAATRVPADPALVGSTIKVTLDKFHVEDYPGLGRHTILLDVGGRNQAGAEREDLRFTTVLEADDGDSAGVSGIPIFTGLRVPADGLAFKVATITIRSRTDDMIVDALKSPTFQRGLKLLGSVQPILPQLVQLAAGVSTTILKRRFNEQVQGFQLGLDFSDTYTSCALRLGSYVAVQAVDDGSWSWSDWRFDQDAQTLVSKIDNKVAPYNFLIFGVSISHASEPGARQDVDHTAQTAPVSQRKSASKGPKSKA